MEDGYIFFCLSDISEVSLSSDDSLDNDCDYDQVENKRKEDVEETFWLDGTQLPYSILLVREKSLPSAKKKKKKKKLVSVQIICVKMSKPLSIWKIRRGLRKKENGG